MGRGTVGGAELARGTSWNNGNIDPIYDGREGTDGETPLLRLKIEAESCGSSQKEHNNCCMHDEQEFEVDKTINARFISAHLV